MGKGSKDWCINLHPSLAARRDKDKFELNIIYFKYQGMGNLHHVCEEG